MAQGSRSGSDGAPKRGTAPSAPDTSKLKKMEASDEAKAHEPSDVDAMGQDKRRSIVGHAYGPSKRSQLIFLIAVVAVGVIVIGGYLAAVATFDQPPDSYADEAPWAQADAEQIPTRSPSGPCGEPGNPHPFPPDSPCASARTSGAEAPAPSTAEAPETERSPGGVGEGPGD